MEMRFDNAANVVCPQGSFGLRQGQALRPFGSCAECAHMSYMSCKVGGDIQGQAQNFSQNPKKGLQSF